MKTTTSLAIVAVLVGTGCAQASGKSTQAPQPAASAGAAKPAGPGAAAAPAGDKKSIATLVKPTRKIDGLFTVYQDTINGSLMMAVSKDKIGKEFIYFTHIVDAPVAAGFFRGAFGANNVFTVEKRFNRLEFVTQNPNHYFEPTHALARAASANISPAVVAVQEILAEDSTSYLIKADDLFLTEAFTQIKPSPNPNARPGENFTLGGLSKAKIPRHAREELSGEHGHLRRLRLRESKPDQLRWLRHHGCAQRHGESSSTASSKYRRTITSRASTIRVSASSRSRSRTWSRRVPRLTAISSTAGAWSRRIRSAALSEPVEPITWWIENTTPVEFRDVIARAVLAWNPAFEAAGFKNAMVVKVQPDDADWDAGDIRYNVLRWTSSPNPPFGGYGPSFVNPRTGQILGADIMLEYVFVTNRVRQEKAFGTAAMGLEVETALDNTGKMCSFADQLQLNVMAGRQALIARGATQIEMRDYINQAITGLILHEVGHTLGLNHNMKASQMLSPKEINDRSITSSKGVMGSVMDYEIVNLAKKGQVAG